jgi:response regulator NasT
MAAVQHTFGRASIVLADDDERFRALVRSVLEDDGYAVIGEAADAPGAIEAARSLRPDVVVLDLVMSGSEGLSTLKDILREDPAQAVVVVSSLFDPVVEREVATLGAWYLEKAEGLEALEHAIDGAVSVSRHQA